MRKDSRTWQRSAARALLTLFVIGVVTVAAAEAGTVRGRLVRRNPRGEFPAQGIPVTVFRTDIGRSGTAYSGPDGMYYLYNTPPGNYWLEVWVYPNSRPLVFTIVVTNLAFSDIAPIVVP